MSDVIDRQAAIDAIGKASDELYENIKKGATFPQRQWFDGMAQAQSILENLPSAQPERKKGKGKWQITDAYPHNVYCSECHTRFAQTHWSVWEDGSLPRNFCPNCGADMREEDT